MVQTDAATLGKQIEDLERQFDEVYICRIVFNEHNLSWLHAAPPC